jgi:hypothetical protein
MQRESGNGNRRKGGRVNRRLFIGTLLLAVSTMALSGCSLFYPSTTIRYRTTVEVETPQGLRIGSSVTEVQRIKKGSFGDAAMVGGHIRAEAVAVDLPGGRTLFALLQSPKAGPDYPEQILASVFSDPAAPLALRGPEAGTLAQRMNTAKQLKPGFTLDRALYPLLVTFTDFGDPKTVTRVDSDGLAASFGPGTKLRRITLQVTDHPVTTGVEKRLPPRNGKPFGRPVNVSGKNVIEVIDTEAFFQGTNQ